jgi:hypothetical protein
MIKTTMTFVSLSLWNLFLVSFPFSFSLKLQLFFIILIFRAFTYFQLFSCVVGWDRLIDKLWLFRIPLKCVRNRNWDFCCYFILSVHNMFRPPRAILTWNTTTWFIYFESAIDTTTDLLLYNCSLMWCKSLIIYYL